MKHKPPIVASMQHCYQHSTPHPRCQSYQLRFIYLNIKSSANTFKLSNLI
jgi:hypothetical protein